MADWVNPTNKDLRQQADYMGIYDVDAYIVGRCNHSVIVQGRGYQCSLRSEHTGWAHQSLEAEILWK